MDIELPTGQAYIPVGNWQLTKVGDRMIFEMYVTDQTVEILAESLNSASDKHRAFARQFLNKVIALERGEA